MVGGPRRNHRREGSAGSMENSPGMISPTAAISSRTPRPERVQTYIDALVEALAHDETAPPLVSVVLFGSASKGDFAREVSDVDLIIVVSDASSRADRLRLSERIARLEMVHEFRPATTGPPRRLKMRIERAVGHAISCFVCTRSDFISGDVARVLDLRGWEAPFVDRIVLASIMASAVT